MAARTRMSPQARRQQLIDLGADMARSLPLEEVTIEAVAEAAGVSRPLVFHYFDSKQEFHLAIVRAQVAELLERTAPRTDNEDPVGVLTEAVTAYVDYAAENSQGFVGLLRGAAGADPRMRAVIDETRRQQMERILHYGPALGVEITTVVRAAVAGWVAFVEELLVRWLTAGELTREQLIDLLVTSLPVLVGAASLDLDDLGDLAAGV